MPKRLQITDEQIRYALEHAQGIRSKAAHFLGISPRTLARRLASNPVLALSQDHLEARQKFEVIKAFYEAAAIGDDVYATIRWLKWCGWGRDVKTAQPVAEHVFKFQAPGSIRLATGGSPAETGEPVDELGQRRKSHS